MATSERAGTVYARRTVKARLAGMGFTLAPDADVQFFYRPREPRDCRLRVVVGETKCQVTSQHVDPLTRLWRDSPCDELYNTTMCRLLAWLMCPAVVRLTLDGVPWEVRVSPVENAADAIEVSAGAHPDAIGGTWLAVVHRAASRDRGVPLSMLRGEMPAETFVDWLLETHPGIVGGGGTPADVRLLTDGENR